MTRLILSAIVIMAMLGFTTNKAQALSSVSSYSSFGDTSFGAYGYNYGDGSMGAGIHYFTGSGVVEWGGSYIYVNESDPSEWTYVGYAGGLMSGSGDSSEYTWTQLDGDNLNYYESSSVYTTTDWDGYSAFSASLFMAPSEAYTASTSYYQYEGYSYNLEQDTYVLQDRFYLYGVVTGSFGPGDYGDDIGRQFLSTKGDDGTGSGAVPEPVTATLGAIGLMALALCATRRRQLAPAFAR